MRNLNEIRKQAMITANEIKESHRNSGEIVDFGSCLKAAWALIKSGMAFEGGAVISISDKIRNIKHKIWTAVKCYNRSSMTALTAIQNGDRELMEYEHKIGDGWKKREGELFTLLRNWGDYSSFDISYRGY